MNYLLCLVLTGHLVAGFGPNLKHSVANGNRRSKLREPFLLAKPDEETDEWTPYQPNFDPSDAYRQEQIAKRKRMQLAKREVLKRQQGLQASAAMDLPEQPVMRTIAGGQKTIFEMARKVLATAAPSTAADKIELQDDKVDSMPLPRWHPTNGISSVNPQFRTKSPIMDSKGYAGIIWRNVRKRNKPSMWRYALRTYDRMVAQQQASAKDGSVVKVKRTSIHYEGALLACAKLGLWERALEIYREVEMREARLRERLQTTGKRRIAIQVNDNMLTSLINACVRAARKTNKSIAERRMPLDVAVKVMETMGDRHDIPLVARHWNPIAAAYQSIGLRSVATKLIMTHLEDRTIGPEAEDGKNVLNVNDVGAKDKASYSLLVMGAVWDGDWAGAVDALTDMTESGLYPNNRHLNAWTEVSERKSKPRATRSWKKKRDEYWLDRVTGPTN